MILAAKAWIQYLPGYIGIIACVPMALRIQIAKLKIHQYLPRANLPNLMLAKFSREAYIISLELEQ